MGALRHILGKKPLPPTVLPRRTSIPATEAGKGKRGTGSGWGISANEADDFVYRGMVTVVSSSNVHAMQYLLDDKVLIIQYLTPEKQPGPHYQYNNVTEQEAITFINAGSKGGTCWDLLRVRGSKTAHKKPFSPVGGFRAIPI